MNLKKLPFGTWMLEVTIDPTNKDLIDETERGLLNGFSVSGIFTIEKSDGTTINVYEEFRKMSKPSDFSSFNIVIYGGSTEGVGRNEHGTAHFHILEKNSEKVLCKIDLPSVEVWTKSTIKEKIFSIKVSDGTDISAKNKKEIIQWLDTNNYQNLIRCHEQWNKNNSNNNRVVIPVHKANALGHNLT